MTFDDVKFQVTSLFTTAKFAFLCIVAQWFGVGKPEDVCGDCWKCATMRIAILAIIAVIGFIYARAIFVLGLLGWLAYSTYTGKGWAGPWLQENVGRYFRNEPPKG